MTIQEMISFLKEKGLVEEYIKSSSPERELLFTDGQTITFETATDAANYLEGMVKAVELMQRDKG